MAASAVCWAQACTEMSADSVCSDVLTRLECLGYHPHATSNPTTAGWAAALGRGRGMLVATDIHCYIHIPRPCMSIAHLNDMYMS